jgi:tetratricopeptide (TPR) repeat protein
MKRERPGAPPVAELIDDGEAALQRGDASDAWTALAAAALRATEVTGDRLARLASAYTAAARIVGEQARALTWLEGLPAQTDPVVRASLLRAQVSMWSRLDTSRALALEADARAAAEAIGDEEGVATILAQAAFAAYRRGDVRRCREIAERARMLVTSTRSAQYQANRARMFAATASGDLEESLNQAMKSRALAREIGRAVDIANESNNLAEIYLELGYPQEARACAAIAESLSRDAGHVGNAAAAQVYKAIALAESGEVDGGIALLDTLDALDQYPIVMIDSCCAHAYWLLERGAAGDAARARSRAHRAIDMAHRTGTAHRLTALHASLARALAREASHDQARDQLERARRGADKVEPTAHSFLALAAAEVLSASEAPRHVILMTARARILRAAARREDPLAFCVHVRLNRRLLELTGGVPTDLPSAS